MIYQELCICANERHETAILKEPIQSWTRATMEVVKSKEVMDSLEVSETSAPRADKAKKMSQAEDCDYFCILVQSIQEKE